VLSLANVVDVVMIRSHIRSQQTSSQHQRCGRGALSLSRRTPRRGFPPRLLSSASHTLNHEVIYINKCVNERHKFSLYPKLPIEARNFRDNPRSMINSVLPRDREARENSSKPDEPPWIRHSCPTDVPRDSFRFLYQHQT